MPDPDLNKSRCFYGGLRYCYKKNPRRADDPRGFLNAIKMPDITGAFLMRMRFWAIGSLASGDKHP